jgi:hypothetical protein
VGSKRKANGLQKGKPPKRPSVEEGDDFLLNEISLAAQNFGPLEFTLRGEPLRSPNASHETLQGDNSPPFHSPSPSTQAHEEFTETRRLASPEVSLRSPTSRSEEDLQGEEPEQQTTADPGISMPDDTPLGGTTLPDTSEAGPSGASGSFDFLGVRLLSDPVEALASVLPDGLFEDVRRTMPFKFAQDIVESQITVFLFCLLLVLAFFS